MANILLTGATGFIGRYILFDLTKLGHKVYAIVRDEDPRERLLEALSSITNKDIPINVISGDIFQENCGIQNISSLPPIEIIFHGAGMPIFDESKKDEVIKTNIGGTKNIISLANKLGVNNIVNLSTAYSCGITTGLISEEPDKYFGWNNTYEKSKHEAENLLYSWERRKPIRRLINFRLPIVTGPYTNTQEGYASASTYLEFMSALFYYAKLNDIDVELTGNPNLLIYIEPVDIVSKAVTQIIDKENAWNKTYHVICSNQQTVGWWIQTGFKSLNVQGKITIIPEPTESSRIGKMIRRSVRQFNPYVTFHPELVTKNVKLLLPEIVSNRIDGAYVGRLMSYLKTNLCKEQKDNPT